MNRFGIGMVWVVLSSWWSKRPARVSRFDKLASPIGANVGIISAAWLAMKLPGYSHAYLGFLLSSCLLSLHLFRNRDFWCMLQQAAFIVINAAGVYHWLMAG